MKTLHTEHVGDLRLVLRSDGGVYLGRPDDYGIIDRDMIRLGSSSAICSALAEASTSMAQRIRSRSAELLAPYHQPTTSTGPGPDEPWNHWCSVPCGADGCKGAGNPLPQTQAELTATLAAKYEREPIEDEE
jgi:hypothetical protein